MRAVSRPSPAKPVRFVAPPRPVRWVARRKAEIVDAVRGGFLSLDDACERYALTVEEFLAWQRGLDRSGLSGLFVTAAARDPSRKLKQFAASENE